MYDDLLGPKKDKDISKEIELDLSDLQLEPDDEPNVKPAPSMKKPHAGTTGILGNIPVPVPCDPDDDCDCGDCTCDEGEDDCGGDEFDSDLFDDDEKEDAWDVGCVKSNNF